MRKLREWFSIQLSKHPGRIVLMAILLFNVVFFVIAALVISNLSLSGTEEMSFFEAAFYTITMILDAGCISYVVADIGESGVAIAVICLVIVLIGMVSFTGAVIGYVTNYISGFIESSNSDARKLRISNHLVILNWNTRASEIVNDLLYCRGKQKVVVLVKERKKEIAKEIAERISDTIHKENRKLRRQCKKKGFRGNLKYRRERLKNNIMLIVREGDVFSAKQLYDISLDKARSVIILGNDGSGGVCKYGQKERAEENANGNALTVKTLMQVSDITGSRFSADNQKIIVEVSDDRTWELVNRIIKYKEVSGKCNIVPVRVNQILGQILSQFPLMPELNLAYRELFSNKGATFFLEEKKVEDDTAYITEYLKNHKYAIPLTSMQSEGKDYFFYSADQQKDIAREGGIEDSGYTVKLNRNYWIESKHVIILGHNSRCKDIMQSFCRFRDEWGYKDGREILEIIVIDDKDSLERMNYYKEYPFVKETVAAGIFDEDIICSTINEFVDSNKDDTSILILSDDSAASGDIDANALANLVYVQDIISDKKKKQKDFDTSRIDVIVEIIDPKHHDIVSSYSVNNVVISNRYISKMITQISEKEAIFDFYTDILTYDSGDTDVYESKEVYAKKVSTFFEELPGECTQAELVRAVWKASVSDDIPKEKQNPTIVLGFVKKNGAITLFGGDAYNSTVKLSKTDKIIVFTNH